MRRKFGPAGLLIFGAGLFLSSCAYQLRRQKLSSGVTAPSQVFVPMADNLSVQAGPETTLTGAVREEMAKLSNVDVVNSEGRAHFILRGLIRDWGRRAVSSRVGSATTEGQGGLIQNQGTASDIKVYLVADFELLEKVGDVSSEATPVLKSVWKRQFRSEGNIEASDRVDELAGSSSAPFINRSRERLQLVDISQAMARQIIDQFSQDF